jgi:hypothetical protein
VLLQDRNAAVTDEMREVDRLQKNVAKANVWFKRHSIDGHTLYGSVT